MSNPYQFLLFDFVNTLVLPDSSGLPVLIVEGRAIPSTAPLLWEPLVELRPGLEPAAVHRAQREAWRWAEEQRSLDHREIPALERFQRLAAILEILPPGPDFLPALVERHMAAVADTMRLPDAHKRLLETLRARYRLGILSNFDHGPPVRAVLRREGVLEWFEPVVVSADIGYRKPGREAFARALAQARAEPQTVLHIGDSFQDDVMGALGAGLDVAWINPGGDPAPGGLPPTFELPSLMHLEALLK